jgi:O-antigen/teichoic acid export membrane protein
MSKVDNVGKEDSIADVARKLPGGAAWRVVGTNAVVKILVMAVSGAIAFVTTRLIIENFGVNAYAQYGLLASMAALVPFADLGMSAGIMNAVAGSASPAKDPVVRATLTSALRILCVSASVLILIAVALGITGLWPAVLGQGLLEGGGTAAVVCVVVFAITLPLGVGQRVLTGLGRNQVQIATQALAAPFVLIAVLASVLLGAGSGNYLAVLTYLAGTVVALTALVLAARYIRPQVGAAIRAVPRVKSVPGVKIMNVAWPMLAQMLALPIAMQTDRLLLSHLGTGAELAQYNLGSQLFGLILQTIGAAGIALWPVFARSRSDSHIRSPFPLAFGFFGVGLALAVVLAALLPWITPIVSDGEISLDPWLIGGFIAFVGVQAAKYPLGMYMTDIRGLRFQVIPIVVMVPINLGISWYLVGVLGAAGPIIGSAIAVGLCQVFPNVWYVVRDLTRRTRESAGRAA